MVEQEGLKLARGIVRRRWTHPALRACLRFGPALGLKRWLVRQLEAEWSSRPSYDFRSTIWSGSQVAGNTLDVIEFYLHLFGILEENLSYWIEEQLAPGDGFVDVGAHVGYFSLLASKLVGPTGRVVAIEPSPKTFAKLQHNLSLNSHCRNVRVVNAASWDSEGTAAIYRGPETGTGMSSLYPRFRTTLEARVHVAPLPALLSEDELSSARLIKIDVEGSEFETVAGLLRSVGRCRTDLEIVVETAEDWQYQGRLGTISDLLSVFAEASFHGYRLEKECEVDRRRFTRPTRISCDSNPEWAYCDIVFSRRNQPTL